MKASKVVIIDPAFLGDTVFNGPLIRALRRGSGAQVGVVVRPPSDALAARLEGVGRVHVFDKRGDDRGVQGLLRMARELQHEAYDIAYIPHPSLRSALLALAAKIPHRVGFRGGLRSLLYTQAKPEVQNEPFVDARLRLAEKRSTLASGDQTLKGSLHSGEGRKPRVSERPARAGLVLGAHWETKRWPALEAEKLVAHFPAGQLHWVYLGSSLERVLFENLNGAVLEGRAENLVGGTIDDLIDGIAGLDLLIAGDTGPLHIARALGVPVVALFGPTAEDRHHFEPRDRVLSATIDCRPCSPHGHRRCPLGHHRCMTTLSADEVIDAIQSILDSSVQS